MTRFKDFGAPDLDANAEPISFKLYDIEFQCVKQIQGRVLLELISSSNADDPIKSTEAINTFFSRVLLPESNDKFNALLEDPEKIVSIDTLGEITAWLVEEYSSRPTQGPSVS